VEKELISNGEMSTWVLDKTGGYDVVQVRELCEHAVDNSAHNFKLRGHMPARVLANPVFSQLPTLMDVSAAMSVQPSKLVSQDPASGQWYECPSLYWMYECPTCKGALKLRCHAELGHAFRYTTPCTVRASLTPERDAQCIRKH
jgi:hypothetical protein